jgi:hypothetical protein
MAPPELIAIFPVRHGAAAIEEARCGEQESAAADGGGPPRCAGADLKPFDQARILGGPHDALSAGDAKNASPDVARMWAPSGAITRIL